MAEIALEAADLAGSLDRGFATLAALRADEARLVVPEDVHCNHRLAEALREKFAAVPSLRRVVLVHPGASVRFLASSLSLLVPEIQFDVVTSDRTAPRRATERADGPPLQFGGVVEARLGEPSTLEEDVREAFERAERTRATAMLFVLDPRRPVERRLAAYLADEIQSMLRLHMLVLVHPAPAIGFLASTLALRCPRVRVVACATEAEATATLRTRT